MLLVLAKSNIWVPVQIFGRSAYRKTKIKVGKKFLENVIFTWVDPVDPKKLNKLQNDAFSKDREQKLQFPTAKGEPKATKKGPKMDPKSILKGSVLRKPRPTNATKTNVF